MAAEQCVTDFGLVAGIVVSEADLSTLAELKPLGAALFKVFMPGKPAVTPRVLWRAIQSAAASGLRMAIHAEEPACLVETVDWRDPLGFARARPVAAETSATAQILEMAGACGAPVHICHVSAARTAELIAEARGRGVDVTAEVTPHHLLLDENKFFAQGARVKTTPPLRSRQDTELLWHALADGVLDAVVSDHFLGSLQPVSQQPEQMQTAAAGIASLELSVPLLFHYGVNAGRISLARFIDALAVRPAQIAGIWPRKGEIVVGADADLVIIDPQSKRQVASLGDFSRNHSSPYLGISLTGQVQRTLVRGRTVWNGQQITVLPGWGKHQPANQH
jgi:dihydroorotase (multifunctional complex type)